MAVEQIGAGESDPSQIAAENAKRQIAMARHGGKQQGCFKLNRADREHELIVEPFVPGQTWNSIDARRLSC